MMFVEKKLKRMRYWSGKRGKTMPSMKNMWAMLENCSYMDCPSCGRHMHWNRNEGHAATITIQHDNDGQMRLMCLGCNGRHSTLGDKFYGMVPGVDVPPGDISPDDKWCSRCRNVKSKAAFTPSTKEGLQGWCKPCSKEHAAKYHAKHHGVLKADREAVKV